MTEHPQLIDEDFQGVIGHTYQDSQPWWPPATSPPDGAPNVVIVLLDDTGYSSFGCYGSEIATPTFDRLAAGGLSYSNFHTTALCSPTRASLLTGRNHHAVGMSLLSNVDSGYPSKRGSVTHRAATIAEVLRGVGYNTMCVGKWHIAPLDQTGAAGPYDQWPLGRGFERYYGFLGGLTDHYYPELVCDNHRVSPPAKPEEGYHLTEDLVDHSIQFVRDQVSAAPDTPFLMYMAFGATHAPHQAPAEYVQRYSGAYDVGWDEIRRRRLARQIELGLLPPQTDLAPRNDHVKAWDDLSPETRDLYARFQEVFAGFLEHTDAQVGRFVDLLDSIGKLDNTVFIVLSDNGASQEGGEHGAINTTANENGDWAQLNDNLLHVDEIDGRRAHVNYPWGWAQAGNTPFKRYKQNTHAGGILDPFIVHWPAGIPARGQVRHQFHHVTDIAPTIYSILGIEAPEVYQGLPQLPVHGVSMEYSFTHADAPSMKSSQLFEMYGHRALWKDGWKAVAYHQRGTSYADDRWELYRVEDDRSECHDLADAEPAKLRELIDAWWSEAARYDVLPLDDRNVFSDRSAGSLRPGSPRNRRRYVYFGDMGHIPTETGPLTMNRSYTITARVHRRADDEGVLLANGNVDSGYVLYIKDRRLVHDYNYHGRHTVVTSDREVPTGECELRFDFVMAPGPGPEGHIGAGGSGQLVIDGVPAGRREIARTLPFLISFEGLDVGRDRLSPVSDAYAGEFPFTGTIHNVTIDLHDDGETSLNHEVYD